jgi:hypothetical protein
MSSLFSLHIESKKGRATDQQNYCVLSQRAESNPTISVASMLISSPQLYVGVQKFSPTETLLFSSEFLLLTDGCSIWSRTIAGAISRRLSTTVS